MDTRSSQNSNLDLLKVARGHSVEVNENINLGYSQDQGYSQFQG